jgi:nitroimidazol reductase NimA-like FMN-containing flavoprotein (pyridoxamine 5'-phosphate oxidase superfamily)
MLERLSERECISLLGTSCVGRVGFVIDDIPEVLPVNYACDATGLVVFRTIGGTLLSRVDGHRVVFEVDGIDEPVKAGWSVCVHGAAQEVFLSTATTAQTLADRSLISWAPGPRDRWFSIAPVEITGRRISFTEDITKFEGWFEGIVS